MELCSFGNLRQWHDSTKTMRSESQCRVIMKDLLQGLNYLHAEKKLIHRDIMMENILIGKNMTIKIADFGLAIDADNVPDVMRCGWCVV